MRRGQWIPPTLIIKTRSRVREYVKKKKEGVERYHVVIVEPLSRIKERTTRVVSLILVVLCLGWGHQCNMCENQYMVWSIVNIDYLALGS